ncbi:MAG: arsenate reductase ArsC [Pyrinomonadaceae bacterium]
MEKKRILVLCTGNSARSQMAEGFLRQFLGDSFEVYSAGTAPGIVRPEAIAVMNEAGIDISSQWSKSVNEYTGSRFDYVLTVCDNAREACPYFPAETKMIHHSFEDPAVVGGDENSRLEAFRRVRDAIREYILGDFRSEL